MKYIYIKASSDPNTDANSLYSKLYSELNTSQNLLQNAIRSVDQLTSSYENMKKSLKSDPDYQYVIQNIGTNPFSFKIARFLDHFEESPYLNEIRQNVLDVINQAGPTPDLNKLYNQFKTATHNDIRPNVRDIYWSDSDTNKATNPISTNYTKQDLKSGNCWCELSHLNGDNEDLENIYENIIAPYQNEIIRLSNIAIDADQKFDTYFSRDYRKLIDILNSASFVTLPAPQKLTWTQFQYKLENDPVTDPIYEETEAGQYALDIYQSVLDEMGLTDESSVQLGMGETLLYDSNNNVCARFDFQTLDEDIMDICLNSRSKAQAKRSIQSMIKKAMREYSSEI